jgi:hypothetical protein
LTGLAARFDFCLIVILVSLLIRESMTFPDRPKMVSLAVCSIFLVWVQVAAVSEMNHWMAGIARQ